MRFIVPVFVFLAVAAFHSALSASLESAEKEEKVVPYDGLAELRKIDQMEFEAAQKNEATQMNVTEEQSMDTHYLEASQDESEEDHSETEEDNTEGGINSDTAAAHVESESESESTEEADGRQKREHHETVTETVKSLADEMRQDSVKEQGENPSVFHKYQTYQCHDE